MLLQFPDNPFHLQLSFHKVIERFEEFAATHPDWEGTHARSVLQQVAEHPELKDGITNVQQIENNAGLIAELLNELFPPVLSLNEIKAVNIPYQGVIFNHSKRFLNILKDAGPSFEINIRDFDNHQFYVLSCCIILNEFYGTRLDFGKPLFYDIPTADGITKHYRIVYNADFLEIIPTANAPKLTQDDIDELMDNYGNLALWKEKFPAGSWIMKGFAIMTLFDVTVENALSILKSNLLGNYTAPDIEKNLESIFRSIFRIPDMHMGFTLFDQAEGKFNQAAFGLKIHSFLLPHQQMHDCKQILSSGSYKSLVQEHSYFAVSDVSEFSKLHPGSNLGEHFRLQNVQSFILAPVIKNGVLLGILELVSPRKKELNSVTANKLEIVMPFLTDTIDRKIHELQNKVQAVIQDYYTTLHPSVYWKFKREAQNYIKSINSGLAYTLKEITFTDVYPLYGQVDISDSSITRNTSVSNDLSKQLSRLILILEELNESGNVFAVEEIRSDLKILVAELSISIKADTEQYIQQYLEARVYPVLKSASTHNELLTEKIEDYFNQSDAVKGDFYTSRRNYDKTLSLINQKLATILDTRQAEIQKYFPHYYERFKTDGIEHNMYIGASILPKHEFEFNDLYRLRLWQLRVTAEMEIEQHDLKKILPYALGVTSLILVFSTPIAIRFRMDEKHFDVDGAYNIRYEVIKKRIDKAHVKGTDERITQQGKITIIYSKSREEQEYVNYISILQSAGLLTDTIERLEVEDLQGVSGLKALRVGVLHNQNMLTQRASSYDELYKQLL